MTAASKNQERVTLLSKRIVRTNRINSNEAMKLQERLDGYVAKHRQQSKFHAEQVQGIKANLNNVVSVKEKMEISPVRRRFLQEHGVNLNMKDVYMEDFIVAVDNVLEKRARSVSTPNRADERSLDAESSSSSYLVPKIRAKSAKTEASSSVVTDPGSSNFPLHLPINLLQKKSKTKLLTESSVSDESLVDEDITTEKMRIRSARAKQAWSKTGHGNFRHYRVITPPIKGRHITEAYKEMEEDEKLVQKLIEKKKFHDRIKSEEAARKRVIGAAVTCKPSLVTDVSNRESDLSDCVSINREDDARVMVHENDSKFRGADTEKEDASSSLEIISQRRRSNTDEEFEKLMQKSLRLKQERITKADSRDEETRFELKATMADSSGIKDDVKEIEQVSNIREKRRTSTVGDSNASKSGDSDRNAKLTNHPYGLNTEDDSLDESSSIDSRKWNELLNKIRGDLKKREDSKRTSTHRAKSAITRYRTSRISHPSAVDADEDIIYDARPDKSVAKGYATMHMTVGKRSVSICVPRFKNEGVCKEQMAVRANAKSELNVEQVRGKKYVKKSS